MLWHLSSPHCCQHLGTHILAILKKNNNKEEGDNKHKETCQMHCQSHSYRRNNDHLDFASATRTFLLDSIVMDTLSICHANHKQFSLHMGIVRGRCVVFLGLVFQDIVRIQGLLYLFPSLGSTYNDCPGAQYQHSMPWPAGGKAGLHCWAFLLLLQTCSISGNGGRWIVRPHQLDPCRFGLPCPCAWWSWRALP